MPANDPPRSRPWESDDDEDDTRPRRRRYDDDGDDDRPPPKQSNGLAIAGLILGALGFVTCGLAALPGLICSAIALGKPTGRGLAAGGLVLSLMGGGLGLVISIGLLLPAVQKVREAASRQADSNNFKQIVLSVHNYDSAYAKLPPADGQLSWRVHILPFIEQEAVYRQFNMNEPWDGPTNKRFASTRVRTYLSASDGPDGTPDTRYRVFVGPGTLYDPEKKGRPWAIVNVPDGSSNTIYCIEAADAVPWPQPKELAYDRNGPVPVLGRPDRNVILVGMLDGSVRAFPKNTSPDAIRGGIDPDDGKFFNP